jgi:hypothetical protein
MLTPTTLSADIMAVGALGTAAFGLVDALKVLPGGGISRAGFKFIRKVIVELTPPPVVPPAVTPPTAVLGAPFPPVPVTSRADIETGGLSRESMLFTLTSQWINGTPSGDQLSIAKSLIKLRLTPGTAASLAKITGVDPVVLTQVATNIANGTTLTTQQSDCYGRFDLLLTTILDQAYQRADQKYRNVAKASAVPVSVFLSVVAYNVLHGSAGPHTLGQAILLGLIATPFAPIAKDLSTAINNSVQAFQALKG